MFLMVVKEKKREIEHLSASQTLLDLTFSISFFDSIGHENISLAPERRRRRRADPLLDPITERYQMEQDLHLLSAIGFTGREER